MALPDQEQVNEELHALADEARNAQPADSGPAAPMSINTGVIAPIFMGRAHEVIPDRYVLHYSITVCANCSAESRDSEFYALSYIKSRVNGTRVRHLIRCDRPMFNLPVDVIPTGKHRLPFCCECETIDLSHLPPPPEESRVTTLAEPTLKGAKPKAEPKAAPKKPTLDDLI